MGHAQSINTTSSSRNVSVASSDGGAGRPKYFKEHKRHGIVTMKMTLHNPTRRNQEQHITQTITPKGCILYGSLAFDPTVVQHAIATSGYPVVPPSSFQLGDNRAHKVLVSYCKGWHIVPFPEVFSRHSGTCLILGDRTITSPPFQVKVGDCFRLGSVGLVVSEMRADGEIEQRIDAKTLEFLKDEALAFDTNGDLATLAADEERLGLDGLDGSCDMEGEDTFDHNNNLNATFNSTFRNNTDTNNDDQTCHTPERAGSVDSTGNTPIHFESGQSPERTSKCTNKSHNHNKYIGVGGISPGERFVCYMCYETHDTEDDALVAPCDCRGDTRYLHVQCLQKWYQASITGVQTQVIRTTGNGAPACKICGSAYKTAFRKADGRKASLLETESTGPYLSLVVVTKHDTNPGLFNTKFRLNFHSRLEAAQNVFADAQDENVITIGRSSSCNMILDYRTVSTIHARISYEADGKFYLTDRNSSNGTMVYLQDPFPLPYNQTLKLRMGRTTLALQAKRNWTSSLRTLLGTSLPASEAQSPSPEDLQDILAQCAGVEDDPEHPVKEDAMTQDGNSMHHHADHNNDHNNQSSVLLQGGMYTRSSQLSPEYQADHNGEIEYHRLPGNPIDLDSHFDPPSSQAFMPYGSHNRVIPLRPSNSLGQYPRYDDGHDGVMSEEERQLQEDINRAIELSLIEQQLLDHHNESLRTAANEGNLSNEVMDHTESAQGKEDPSFVDNGSANHSPRVHSPSTKKSRNQAGLNYTYTDYSEGEIGIAGYAATNSPLDIINSIPSNFDNNRKLSAILSTPPRSRQVSQGALLGNHFVKTDANEENTEHLSPRLHLSGTSSPVPQMYNNISVLSSGRLVMHDTTLEQVIGNNQDETVEESAFFAKNGSPNANELNNSVGSSNRTQDDELSTSLPTAGAFTTFGQMSHRRNNLNSNVGDNHVTNTYTGDVSMSPRVMDIKENNTPLLHKQALFSRGTLSKEHSFKKNVSSYGNISVSSSSNSITGMPQLEKQKSSVRGELSDRAQNSSSPSMQRNATTLDLETSPDHDDHSSK